jgi:V/A-type H+-transporting ATPase subunit C
LNKEQLYSSVLVKIGVEKSQLLSKQKLERLTDCKTLTEIASELGQTVYGKKLGQMTPPYKTNDFERVFRENLIDVCIKMVQNTPDFVSEFLKTYLLKFEQENITTILRAVSIGLPYEEITSKLYLSVEKFLKRQEVILKAANALQVKSVIDALQTTTYGPSLITGLQKYEETGSTKYFDILLDRLFFEKLGQSLKDLPKNEQEIASFYVSRENDRFNILTLLRAKLLGYDPHWIRMALSRDVYNVPQQTIEAMLMTKDFESAFNIVKQSYYKKLFVKAETPEETLSATERAFRREIFQHVQKINIGDPFNIGSPIAFIVKKEIELRNLTAICLGIEYGKKKADILSWLLF